jgi:xylulokinase
VAFGLAASFDLLRALGVEGSAFGAALLGGVAGGLFANVDQGVEACVRVRDQIDPEPAWVDLYTERRERFRALYPALKEVLG